MVAASSAVVLLAGGVSAAAASVSTSVSTQVDRSITARAGGEVRAKAVAKVPVSVVMSPNGRQIEVEIEGMTGLTRGPALTGSCCGTWRVIKK